MINGVVDGLYNLFVPVCVFFFFVENVVNVHGSIVQVRTLPFQEHRVSILAAQIGHVRRSRSSYIRCYNQRF